LKYIVYVYIACGMFPYTSW